MKIIKTLFLILFFTISIFIAGCNENCQSIQTFKIASTEAVNSNKIHLILIRSTRYSSNLKQKEVLSKINAIINSGKYNVLWVKTLYSSSGYLTEAEVAYVPGQGNGNNVRITLLYSNKFYGSEKADDINIQLDKVVNSDRYNLLKVNTVYIGRYLLAAEVYYREKQ